MSNTADVPLTEAAQSIANEKAGVLPPFIDESLLVDGLRAWDVLYNNPEMAWCQDPRRYLMGPDMYLQPAFAEMATHPVAIDIARRVLDAEPQLASYHVVATPKNATEPTPVVLDLSFHVDHVIYSDVPVPQSPDNVFVCLWINFHEMTHENGPLCLAVGTDKFDIDASFFAARPNLTVADMYWGRLIKLNIGPAGTTGVYSGKTWHRATQNCSDRVRKGLQIMYTPVAPKTPVRRPWFDIAGLDERRHAELKELIAGRITIPEREEAQRSMFLAERDRFLSVERSCANPEFVRPWVLE